MSTKARLLYRLAVVQAQLTSLHIQVSEIVEELEEASGFELVGSGAANSTPSVPVNPGPKSFPKTSAPAGRPQRYPVSDTALAVRERAATETGHFFRRCINGQVRGSSGRDLVDLPTCWYVVVREFSGVNHHHPVLRYTRWTAVRTLVANPRRNSDFGDSIFAGFHEEWEARLAVSVAGLSWPEHTD